jgi:hypothetical protein
MYLLEWYADGLRSQAILVCQKSAGRRSLSLIERERLARIASTYIDVATARTGASRWLVAPSWRLVSESRKQLFTNLYSILSCAGIAYEAG